jgi:hypothetical protein
MSMMNWVICKVVRYFFHCEVRVSSDTEIIAPPLELTQNLAPPAVA